MARQFEERSEGTHESDHIDGKPSQARRHCGSCRQGAGRRARCRMRGGALQRGTDGHPSLQGVRCVRMRSQALRHRGRHGSDLRSACHRRRGGCGRRPFTITAFSAQLKCAIDRIHGIDDLVRGRGKLLYTVVVGASPADWIFDGVRATVATSARYLGWRDCGGLYANGCQSREDLEGKGWLDDAYDLGMSIAKRQASSLESNLSKGL